MSTTREPVLRGQALADAYAAAYQAETGQEVTVTPNGNGTYTVRHGGPGSRAEYPLQADRLRARLRKLQEPKSGTT